MVVRCLRGGLTRGKGQAANKLAEGHTGSKAMLQLTCRRSLYGRSAETGVSIGKQEKTLSAAWDKEG